MNSEERRFYKNADVSCRPEEPEGAILYNAREDRIELLNLSGLLIWNRIDGSTLHNIAEEVTKIFEDSSFSEVKKDVEEFLINLSEKGFVNAV